MWEKEKLQFKFHPISSVNRRIKTLEKDEQYSFKDTYRPNT
jgi:hypothetical protein